MATRQRAERADARANREAILCAAGELFKERGLDVSFEDIAQAAEVGRATVYRHFATREELLGALFGVVVAEAEAHLVDVPPDADVLDLVRTVVRVHVDHLPLIDTLRAHGPLGDEVTVPLRSRLEALFADPLIAAKAAGRVRDDLTTAELRLLVAMLATVLRPAVPAADQARALRIAELAIRPR